MRLRPILGHLTVSSAGESKGVKPTASPYLRSMRQRDDWYFLLLTRMSVTSCLIWRTCHLPVPPSTAGMSQVKAALRHPTRP